MSEKPPKKPKRPVHHGEVESVRRLTPGMIRVVLGGDGLSSFRLDEYTDSYVKVQIPPEEAPYSAPFDLEQVKADLPRQLWPRVRSITVRAWDPARRLLTLDFVDHGDAGFAGPWAASARPGDLLQLAGPGGDYAPDPAADWHLMVGDAAALPAISASLERVPAGVPAIALIGIDSPENRLPLETPGRLHLSWHREIELPRAVEGAALPSGRGQAFVHGEAEMVRAVRRHLLVERGLEKQAVSASGYWKRDRTDEAWRAEKKEWKRQVEADLASGLATGSGE